MIEADHRGEYLNVFIDGDLVVSVSEEHSEIAVYRTSDDEPVAVHDLE
jgi:hypothetical protein